MVRVKSDDVREIASRTERTHSGQRVWNAQPVGWLAGLGISPSTIGSLGFSACFCVGNHGNGGDQRARVGMRRRIEQLSHRPDLDQAAEIEDADAGDEIPHQAEVVRDEDVGEAERTAELDQEIDDLGLDRHVERRSRLVEHDQLRLRRERARDRDALLLAARQFMRIAGGGNRRAIAPCPSRRATRRSTSARASSARLERHRDRLADRAARVERGARILEDHLDRLGRGRAVRLDPRDRGPRTGSRPRSAPSSPTIIRAIVDLPEPLSPARPNDFALGQREADVVDRLHFALDPAEQPAAQRERLAEADDLEQRLAHAASSEAPAGRAGGRRRPASPSGGRAQAPIARRTARREAAAGRRRGIVGQRAVDAAEGRVAGQLRHAVDQRARIGMAGPGEQLGRGAVLDDASRHT